MRQRVDVHHHPAKADLWSRLPSREVKYTRSYDVLMAATPHNEEDFQRLRNSIRESAGHPRLKLSAFDAAYFGSGSWLKV